MKEDRSSHFFSTFFMPLVIVVVHRKGTVIVKAAHAHDLRGSDGLFSCVPGILICLVKIVLSSFSYLPEKFPQKDPGSMMLIIH